MDGRKPTSTLSRRLIRRNRHERSPLISDVRRRAGFDADGRIPVGALLRAAGEVGQWVHRVPVSRSVVVYCAQAMSCATELCRPFRHAVLTPANSKVASQDGPTPLHRGRA
jgi:hypothetical protein